MSFKSDLIEFKKSGLQLYRLLVASDLYCIMGNLDDNDFEVISEYVYNWVMNTEAQPYEVIGLIDMGIKEEVFTINDIYDDERIVKDYINDRF